MLPNNPCGQFLPLVRTNQGTPPSHAYSIPRQTPTALLRQMPTAFPARRLQRYSAGSRLKRYPARRLQRCPAGPNWVGVQRGLRLGDQVRILWPLHGDCSIVMASSHPLGEKRPASQEGATRGCDGVAVDNHTWGKVAVAGVAANVVCIRLPVKDARIVDKLQIVAIAKAVRNVGIDVANRGVGMAPEVGFQPAALSRCTSRNECG